MKHVLNSEAIHLNNSLFGFINFGHMGDCKSFSIPIQTRRIPKNTKIKNAIQNNDIYMICLKRFRQNESYISLTNSRINLIFRRISAIIENHRRIRQGQYIFVQFSDNFFEENKLDNAQILYIVEKFRQLSEKNNILIVSTFLHKFNIGNRLSWINDKDDNGNKGKITAKRKTNFLIVSSFVSSGIRIMFVRLKSGEFRVFAGKGINSIGFWYINIRYTEIHLCKSGIALLTNFSKFSVLFLFYLFSDP